MSLDHAFQRLRRLNESVPRPARLPTKEEVEVLEASVGATFHPDFKRYLLEASDVVVGRKEPVTALPESDYRYLPSVVEHARALEVPGVPRELMPLCEDNSDFFLMNDAGEVIFWSHDGATDERWPDLATWIDEVWIGEG
ncbi:MAG: SMI1/KNR4 family protein [Actinomycetota bacterium]